MKLGALGAQDVKLDHALEQRVDAPVADPVDPEQAWLRGLSSKKDRDAGAPVAQAGQALGGQAAIFGPGLQAKATNGKRLFADVAAALSDLPPEAGADDLRRVLGGLGFSPAGEKGGWVTFARGKAKVRLRPFSIGGLPAAELDVSVKKGGKKKKADRKRGVFFQGSVFKPKHWGALQDRYLEEVGRFVRAVRADEGPLPEGFDALKDFMQRGMSAAEIDKREARAEELDVACANITEKLEAMAEAGTAPKGVVVYVAGPDAAGKTSTGGIIMRALEEAGFDPGSAVFKAPTAEEREQHWLKRFERGVPEPGQAIFWDRGPAGDSVYGPADDARAAEMGGEMQEFEAELRDRGILLVKVELSANSEKQAATFGKRLARQHIAAKLESALAAEGELDGDAQAGLAEIKGKLDGADFTAFADFERIQGRFMRFVDNSSEIEPWLVIDASKRHAARLDLLDGLGEALDRFAAQA